MRDRLEVLRGLLAQDGSIWVAIDDNEAHYLKVLMDDVFGRENFVSTIVWEKADSPRNSARQFSSWPAGGRVRAPWRGVGEGPRVGSMQPPGGRTPRTLCSRRGLTPP
jgi:hypothetical protein